MKYSEDFKKRVKENVEWKGLEEMLENGDTFVGRVLDESRSSVVSSKALIEAIDKNDAEALDKLYSQAKKGLAIGDLYKEWFEMYEEFVKNDFKEIE